MKEFNIGEYKCELFSEASSNGKLVYMIYPAVVPISEAWLQEKVSRYGCAIAVVYVPASLWNDALTPWPEPGETRDAQPFGGKAPEFMKLLVGTIVPTLEKSLPGAVIERNLIGVSLSGLFTLWEWLQDSTFFSIASLSGSFWYLGFMDWFASRAVPPKKGKAFFLLGKKEPEAAVRTFRSVGENTEKIVERLKSSGIDTEFTWVPGDHFSDPLGRATLAFEALYK